VTGRRDPVAPSGAEEDREMAKTTWTVRVLGDVEVGGAVSALAPEGDTVDSGRGPSEAEIASLAGVQAVKFVDAGDHPTRVEQIYKITEV
jgi:hypothetical protein